MPELGSWSLFDRCLTVLWSVGSISVCELVRNVSRFLGESSSEWGSLQNQVSKVVVAGIRRELTSYARFPIPPTFPGASGGPGSSNVSSMSTIRP